MALLQGAIRQLEEALPMLASEPEVGPQLMKAVEGLRKLVPEGAVPKGIADAAQQGFMQDERKRAPILAMLQALAAAKGGAPQAGAGAGMPGPMGGGGLPAPPGGPMGM
jgi:hypothetical protein